MSDAGHAAAADPVQRALAEATPPVRAGIERLCVAVQREVPGALPVLSYAVPAWRDPASAKVVCGFALTRAGWSLYPFSGNAVPALGDRLDAWHATKGAIHVPPQRPLPDDLLVTLVRFRLQEIAERGR